MNKNIIILFLVLALVFVLKQIYDNQTKTIETVKNVSYAPVNYVVQPSLSWLSDRGMLPWWNSTRSTRNMSYDIRGGIPPIHYDVGPWLNSGLL